MQNRVASVKRHRHTRANVPVKMRGGNAMMPMKASGDGRLAGITNF